MRYIKLSATNLATQNHVQKQGQALSSTNLAQSAFLSNHIITITLRLTLLSLGRTDAWS
jgi:hypothetical protein